MGEIVKIGSGRAEVCFQLDGTDKVWRIPTLDSLPMKRVLKLSELSAETDAEAQEAAIELIDELCPGLTDELTLGEFRKVFDLWMSASSVSLGESQASPE